MSIHLADMKQKGRCFAFFLFCITTCQLVFQKPYIVILPDERAKIFSATLCLLTLIVTIALGRDKRRVRLGPDFWISLVLGIIVLMSSIFSVAPRDSLQRAFVILSAALAGYWCSRFLLIDPGFRKIFLWMANALLVCVIFLALLGLFLNGKPHEFLDAHWHPVASRLLLMSFAPLSLLLGDLRREKIIGGTILFVDLIAIYLVGRYAYTESMLIIPGILCVVAFFLLRWEPRTRRILAILVTLTIVAAVFFVYLNPKKLDRNHISVSYRIESLFFSIHIASKNPWLGNGLWAPRISSLKGYALHYPYLSKDQFSEWVKVYRTSENLYLTFLADLGIPFFLLYFGSLLYIFFRLVRFCRDQFTCFIFHPAAIFLPLMAECLRFFVLDDLFHPQSSWFFHILLGLAVICANKECVSCQTDEVR
ncbi:MAG: O-antigen ligase family protein [Deltaproteobacteria bacterium]|nr:O-antigen ligase family protein [Deltaproteobacteria bacterium]